MKTTYILVSAILLIVLCVFLIFYPLRFDFYEQLKAKKIVDLFFLPAVLIFLTNYVLKTVKKDDFHWKIFSKEILFAAALFGIIYFTILRSVFSCGLLFINCALAEKELVEVNGRITDIVKIEGHGKVLGRYELTINQNGKEFNFESNKKAIENLSLNENFKIEMKKGILNLMYK